MAKATADIGGTIRVGLRPENGRVGAVEIASTRPVRAASIFAGKPVAEMTTTIGRVFSLCGKAQTVAALRAAEAALRIAPDPGVEAARDLARLAEMLTQTTMRLALHWPRVLGLPLQPDIVRACLEAEHQIEHLVLGGDWRVPGAVQIAPNDEVADILGQLDARIAATSLADDLAKTLSERGLDGFGALPAGIAPELGALTRTWDAPLVIGAVATHGAGLAARLEASRAELLDLPLQMIAMYEAVTAAKARPATRTGGTGETTVETARGPLMHRVTIEDGIVLACETAAPTEENFAADGPVAAGLRGAPLDAVAAELHVLAIDPCVGCTVEIRDA